MWLYTMMLLVGSTLGQYPQPQPSYNAPGNPQPSYNTPGHTVTRTTTITAIDCRTQDAYTTHTAVAYNQQTVTVVLCTKNLATETVQLQIVTPVDDRLVVRTRTQQLQPRTTVVTDTITNFVISTVTYPIAATLTHISQVYYSTTLTETLTHTVTRTNLVTRTRVNTRTHTTTIVQTIVNTIIVDAPRLAARPAALARGQRPAIARPAHFAAGAAPAGVSDGQVFGFGGEAASGRSDGSAGYGARPAPYQPAPAPVAPYQPAPAIAAARPAHFAAAPVAPARVSGGHVFGGDTASGGFGGAQPVVYAKY